MIIADVKGAFDNIWREALWAKLLDAHQVLDDVKRIATLYEGFCAMIREPDFETEIMEWILGLPQGGPRSGDGFTFFTSDLPEEFLAEDIGTTLFGIFICVAIFLDDHMIPCRCPRRCRERCRSCMSTGSAGRWSGPCPRK